MMTLKRATEIVLELAREGVLEVRQCAGDHDLEAARQEQIDACDIVERHLAQVPA